MKKGIQNFVNNWRAFRSSTEIDIERWFKFKALEYKDSELIYISERMLQTYLFLNIEASFPECKELLVYERPLFDKKSYNAGRCDFVYLTYQNKIMLIETKVIDDENTSSSAKTRRTKHRQKVVQQVLRGKSQLKHWFKIPKKKIVCSIFTTDLIIHRRMKWDSKSEVDSAYVSLSQLRNWFKNEVSFKDFKEEERNLRYMNDNQNFGWP